MLAAIDGLTMVQFIILVLAILTSLFQLALLVALATHVHRIPVWWGIIAVALWIAFFAVTR